MINAKTQPVNFHRLTPYGYDPEFEDDDADSSVDEDDNEPV